MNDYRDIIDYNYTGPKNHPRMTRENRAAQFASFRALSGYDDKIREARRIVDSKIDLSEDEKIVINNKLLEIQNQIDKCPLVKITYFVKDLKRNGGFYKTITTSIKKIDLYNYEIVLLNKQKIRLDNIIFIDIVNELN